MTLALTDFMTCLYNFPSTSKLFLLETYDGINTNGSILEDLVQFSKLLSDVQLLQNKTVQEPLTWYLPVSKEALVGEQLAWT